MDQCVCKVVDAMISPLVDLTTEHLAYLFKADDNVNDLAKAARELAARKQDVEERIKKGERAGGTPMKQVSEWVQGAESIVAEAAALERRYGERGARCLGDCSINCWSDVYTIGKAAAKMLPEARNEYERGVFEQVVVIPAGRHDKSEIDNPPSVGREHRYFDQAVQLIKDEAVKAVGIWGMGGVGKTHLLTSINNSFARQTYFDVVIFVTASRQCSVAKIQSEIVKKLDLSKSDDVETQAGYISGFLREKSFLFLLDDLWERLDLAAVGVPLMASGASGDRRKRKVVLTTRYFGVCGQMEVSKRNAIRVDPLDWKDAWHLFREKVGEETIRSDHAIENLAKQVADKLKGLPLALITIGRAMYAKEDPNEWRHALSLLHEARHDEVDADNEESLFHTLKFSYDSLRNDALRECLLCCSLWPEDYCIPKNDLIECLLGLGIIDGFDDMQSAYNVGYDLVGSLRSACLLTDDDFGFGVRVHDVICDMALWIACECGQRKKKWFVKAKLGLMEDPRGAESVWSESDRISLMHNKIEAFHLPIITSSPAKLASLMLQGNRLSEFSLATSPSPSALTYLDLSHNSLNRFPESICRLTALRYLNLSFNEIRELPEELKFLTSLEYLLLRESTVLIIPAGVIRELEALQMLDLHGCPSNVNLKYPPSLFEELEGLNNLKALGISVEGANQLHRLDELRRTRIRSLHIFLLEQTILPLQATPLGSFRIQNNLSDLTFAGSTALEEIVFDTGLNPCRSFHNLEELSFNAMPRLNIRLDRLAARELFPRLSILDFRFCYQLKDVSWIVHLPCLRVLVVRTCTSIAQLIYSAQDDSNEGEIVANDGEEARGRASIPTFPSLKRISLADLPALHCVCDPAYTFPSLEQFYVRMCRRLTKLPFRPHTVPRNLKSIRGDKRWWEGIEWEDNSLRSSLEPLFVLR